MKTIERNEKDCRASAPGAIWHGDGPCEDVLLVDVRTPGEFREAHIPGSYNAPLGDLERLGDEIRARAAGRRVVLVCRTGRRAATAHELLRKADVEAVHDLEVVAGGLAAWETEGLPVNRGKKAVSLERQVRIGAGLLVLAGVLLGLLVHPALFGISAFVGAGLVFAGVTDTCGMTMVLARMPWNRGACTAGRG